ncbi:hypothetical protein [Bacillus sp. EB600]|uniref:hypothetical protein n=1 Tax=Bacillus sp. EB600 TaxID=2806345 RepID=UPI00210C913D|nr:hypothetical protein [Bacillus sp. EB600]MCQ6282037.1 hypothetical protein [Bacillus sp. EB600]
MDYTITYTKNLFTIEPVGLEEQAAVAVPGVDLEDQAAVAVLGVDLEEQAAVVVLGVVLEDHVVPTADTEGHVNPAGAVQVEVRAVVHVC